MIGDSQRISNVGATRPFLKKDQIQKNDDGLPKDQFGLSPQSHEPVITAQKFQGSSKSHEKRNRNWQDSSEQSSVHLAGSASLQGAIGLASSLKHPDGRWDLAALATKALQQYNLATEYPADVKAQVADIVAKTRPAPGVYNLPDAAKQPWVRDMRDVPLMSVDNGALWSTMDPKDFEKDPFANVQSRDLDQIQRAERLPDGNIRVTVAVSDVGAFVPKDSPLDKFMDINTSSIYTPDKVFNLVPPELAEDIISLNPGEDRFATVVSYTVTPDGEIKDEDVGQAIVRSQAKLDYSSVGAWLDGKAEASPGMKAGGQGIIDDLKLQAEASAWIEKGQDMKGALEFDTTETRIITEKGNAIGVEESEKNKATEMVENFMVTTNSVMSRFLRSKGMGTLERVVAPPEKWDKIAELAKKYGGSLPSKPSAKALADFMAEQKAKAPDEYGDLSISIIKLVGRGEYQSIGPNDPLPGHFPLGVSNYTQTTASIRRGGDRVPGHSLRAVLEGKPFPYTPSEVAKLADNLNEKAQQVKKAERMAEKAAVATMLESRVGETFPAVVTGVKDGRAWCRISNPPVEGSLKTRGTVKVGDKVNALLTKVDVEKGFIDFQQTR